MDLGLHGREALVTGATKGIGLSIAEHFAREGAALAICARSADDVAASCPACKAWAWRRPTRRSTSAVPRR